MRSSFSRNFFPAAVILLVALLLVGTTFQILVEDYLTQSTLTNLEADGRTIADLASAYYTQGTISDYQFLVNLSVASQISNADTVICDASGKLLLCSNAPLGCQHQGLVLDDAAFLHRVFEAGSVTSTGVIQNLYEDSRYVAAVRITDAITGDPAGIVILSTPTAQTQALLKKMADIYLFVSILVVAVAVIIMTVMARKMVKPLRELARTASAFGHGKLDARVSVDENGTEEMQELTLSFNNMAASLQKSEYQRQEFVANVSHELKTPMTVISGYVDGMLDGTIPPERHKYYMKLVSDETKRLSRLVRSMLDISRLQDQDIPDEKKTRFDLCECAGQALITFEQKINDKALDVQVDFPELPVYTFASQDAITQVIYNLVDNAVKFCPREGRLSLTIHAGDTKAYVSVSNEGQTIPPEELPLVFDRFHKLDKARGSTQEGWGLGLYIVKTLVCSHGEDISVSSRDGVTEFTFTLPIVN